MASGRRSMTYGEVIKKLKLAQILGSGSFESKRSWAGDAASNKQDSAAAGWPFGAQAVEVKIDRETGVIKLVRVASAHENAAKRSVRWPLRARSRAVLPWG